MADAFALDGAREDLIILVDALDREVGTATKERAHREDLLHRALSVMLWREGPRGPEILLARRAPGKYHSSGLWANSCCSHPRAGEELMDAAYRRVGEELGVEAQGLRELGSFVYRAVFEGGLSEYEFDHVILGRCVGELKPDPTEVDAVRWVPANEALAEMLERPETFCAWAYNVLSLALQNLDGLCCP